MHSGFGAGDETRVYWVERKTNIIWVLDDIKPEREFIIHVLHGDSVKPL